MFRSIGCSQTGDRQHQSINVLNGVGGNVQDLRTVLLSVQVPSAGRGDWTSQWQCPATGARLSAPIPKPATRAGTGRWRIAR